MNNSPEQLVQKKPWFRERRFQFLPGGLLKAFRKTALIESEWTVNLSHVNPEARTVKVSSRFWFSILLGSVIGMILVLVTQYFNHNPGLSRLDFLGNFLLYFVGALVALPSYLLSKVQYLFFHYDYDGEPLAFGLFASHPNATEFANFVEEIKNQIKTARVRARENDLLKVKNAMTFLIKEQVINDTVANIIHYRMDDMSTFSNE